MTIVFIKRTAKAIVALVATTAAYLVGILSEDQNLGDITFVQWLGLVIFMSGAYGITYGVKNKGSVTKEQIKHALE